ncbi:MAG: hypothetical protein J07HB67_00387 [halophilic archaeon J07HB67]|nr:MAG: hypothetical protein J07HB67_00387 [halophilic archaeon J07HB67]
MIDSVAEVSPVFESRARDILADEGIESPAPESTHDATAFAAAMETIVETAGETTVARTGEKMIAQNEQVTAATDFESGFETLREQHAAVHRNFDVDRVGQYRTERLDDREYRVATYGGHSYPPALTRGVVEGVVEQTDLRQSSGSRTPRRRPTRATRSSSRGE